MSDMDQGAGAPNQPPPPPGDAASPPPPPGDEGPPGVAPPPPPEGEEVRPPATQQERTMGMLCHLLAFSGIIVPFGNIIGPLVIWLMKKDESPYVDAAGKESLNFQITVTIAMVVGAILTVVCIGAIIMAVVGIAAIVLVIIASIKTNEGTGYRYPWNIRFIK